MSCTAVAAIRLLAPLAGIPAERLAMAVDVIKRKPSPPIALDDAMVDALATEASHIPFHDARAVLERQLQEIVQGMIFVLNTSPDVPTAARIASLIHALAAEPPPLLTPAPEPLVQRLRELLQRPPAPQVLTMLPLRLSDQQRAVIGSLRHGAWTKRELRVLAANPTGAAIALAAGIDHPDLRSAVLTDPAAAVIALSEGYTDPPIIAKAAATGRTARDTLIARPDLAWNTLLLDAIMTGPEWLADEWLAEVLGACPSIPVSDRLLAVVCRSSASAAHLLIQRPETRTDANVLAAVQSSHADAAEVIIKCPELRSDPRLLAAVARSSESAATVLAQCPPLPSDPDLIAAVSWPLDAATVLLHRPDLRFHPRLITVLKQATRYRTTRTSPLAAEAAAQVLSTVPETHADDELIALASRSPAAAAQTLIACPPLRTNATLIAAAKKTARTALDVLLHCPDLHRRKALITAVAGDPNAAARLLIAYPSLSNEALIVSVARMPRKAAQVLIERPDLRSSPILWTAAVRNAQASAEILIHCPDLPDPERTTALLDAVAAQADTAAKVLIQRRDLRDPRLLAAVATDVLAVTRVIIERPDLIADETLRRAVMTRSETALMHVIKTIGPHPAWWSALSPQQMNVMMEDWCLSTTERAWMMNFMQRARDGVIVWTKEDDQISARFRWQAILRYLLTHAADHALPSDA